MPAPSSDPASIAASAPRASDQERGSSARGAAGPTAAVAVPTARPSSCSRLGVAAPGTSAHPIPSTAPTRASVESRRPTRPSSGSGIASGAADRGSRQPAAWAARADLGVARGRVPQEQGEELAAAALALALLLALRLGVALDRVGGELVDVGEDRLGEEADLLGVGVGAAGGGGDPPPGDPGADAVGRLERVEVAALPELPPAQPDIDVAAGLPPASGSRTSETNCRSASVTPVRSATPKAPSSGRAYSGTSSAIVVRISSVAAGSSGSIASASAGERPRQGSGWRFFVICLIRNYRKSWASG